MPYADPEKQRAYMREYGRTYFKRLAPERVKERNARAYQSSGRNNHLLRTYGLTEADVERMKQEQDGRCAICKEIFPTKACVDHCHVTLKVRGLLCHRCNSCLAAVEQLGWLEAVKEYLKKHTIC